MNEDRRYHFLDRKRYTCGLPVAKEKQKEGGKPENPGRRKPL
jgi:hypothetical protein